MFRTIIILSLLALPAWPATITVDNAADLRSSTNSLKPGDTLLVQPGNYDVSTWDITNISGSAAQPIVIRANGNAVIRSTSGCCNLVQISNVHYLEFIGFEITMLANNPGIDGINIRGTYNSHLVFDSLYIHHMTNVGIGMWPDSAAHITLRNSEIAHNTGSGLYWGYPDRNTIHDVLIERNYIHHCPVAGQSTHYGIQWKGWCYRAVIQDNVLHDVGGTTRCGIVVYYGRKPLEGDVAADINIVRGNVLWNCRNEGITVMSDALIENNIIFDAVTGINIQQYSDGSFSGSNYVENLAIRNNTVYRCSNTCISVGGWGSAGTDVSLTGNVVYQDQANKNAITGGNVWLALLADNYYYGQSAYFTGFNAGNGLTDFASVTASAGVPDLDFYPSASSPFIKAFTNPGIAVDFNGTDRSRSLTEAGAYAYTTPANPGWTIQEGFKDAGPSTIWHLPDNTAGKTLPDLNMKQIILYNITGSRVRTLSDCPSGIYIGRASRTDKCFILYKDVIFY